MTEKEFTAEFELDLYQDNFRRKFYELSEEAGIPKELGHSHILRHLRAMELLKSGIQVTIVQNLIGHAAGNSNLNSHQHGK